MNETIETTVEVKSLNPFVKTEAQRLAGCVASGIFAGASTRIALENLGISPNEDEFIRLINAALICNLDEYIKIIEEVWNRTHTN